MDAHIDALNRRDQAALVATLHFPHFRLSGTDLKMWETPDDYFADFRARAGSNWGHSTAEVSSVLDASETKVHLDVKISRLDQDGNLLKSFQSLWVMIHENGVWAAKFRSSFAGD